MRSLALGILLCLCACQRESGPTLRATDGSLPNILLVTVDTLRADHLGCYSAAAAGLTPSIDGLAAEGIRFDRASAPVPATLPSLASLLTGRYPGGHPVRTNLGRLPAEIPVLAQILGDAGYTTAAFYGNSLLDARSGFARGFEGYTSFVGFGGAVDPRGADMARGWFGFGLRQPWFLWVHFMDPHGPYDSAPPSWSDGLSGGTLPDAVLPFSETNYGLGVIPKYQRLEGIDRASVYRRRYAGEVRFTDAQVGRLLDAVDEHGLRARTLVILTADHGESLGEHDYYFQHGWFPYEAGIRVPLLMRLPGGGRATGVAQPVSLVDVLPTLVRGLGLSMPDGVEGRDLSRALVGGEPPGAAVFAVTAYANQMTAVREGGWKLVHTPRVVPPAGDPWARFYATSEAFELFDLDADPAETRNLAAAEPSRMAALRDVLLGWERAHGIPFGKAPEVDLDAQTRERLRDLGYGS